MVNVLFVWLLLLCVWIIIFIFEICLFFKKGNRCFVVVWVLLLNWVLELIIIVWFFVVIVIVLVWFVLNICSVYVDLLVGNYFWKMFSDGSKRSVM